MLDSLIFILFLDLAVSKGNKSVKKNDVMEKLVEK